MTRVAWHGLTARGHHAVTWEDQAGALPSQVQHPGLTFVPAACWCPVCLVVYHIGTLHPVEDSEPAEEPKRLVVVP